MMKEGALQNLYKVDFTNAIAVTTGEGGRLFFSGVFSGAIPELYYQGEGTTIFIGHVESEDELAIRFDKAVAISPLMMQRVQIATNYSPLDCFRGLLNDIRQIRPEFLGPVVISKAQVLERLELANS